MGLAKQRLVVSARVGTLYTVSVVPLLFVPGLLRFIGGLLLGAVFIRFIARGLNDRDAPISTNSSAIPPADSCRLSIGFRIFRAAFITAAVWCTSILGVAWHVYVPYKWRPGTVFAVGVQPAVLLVSFCLFCIGAVWCSSSVPARDSDVVKACVYLAFTDMIVAFAL